MKRRNVSEADGRHMQNCTSETAKTFHGSFSVFVAVFYVNCSGTISAGTDDAETTLSVSAFQISAAAAGKGSATNIIQDIIPPFWRYI